MKNKIKINRVKPSQVREAINTLWNTRDTAGGCYHFPLYKNAFGYEYDLVIGWHGVGDCNPDYGYYDRDYAIAWKIGTQSPTNGMQTDMDLDFRMPYDQESGDVVDTLHIFYEKVGKSFKDLANLMNSVAKDTINFCECDEEGQAYTPGRPKDELVNTRPLQVTFEPKDLWTAQDQSNPKISMNVARHLFNQNREYIEELICNTATEAFESIIDEHLHDVENKPYTY